ncbi:H-NS histone family protein [Desulforhopalus vacuolatus]|uniref:H-NS histone family protein n=1 Tax=Desulforhopalus vacuolatus TaxID=40414 RepID=UPI00196235F6|nr:H-NS family nucleoid-associated regulatory protein [Desulforhopalus vacuolatus]MBM9518986.1 H-NS histone family protein [Desulforhopalus vacuolatus]
MQEFVKIITHARRLKSAVKSLDIEQLEEIKEKLELIIADRYEEIEEQKRENEEKLADIEAIKEIMARAEISVDEISGGVSGNGRKGKRAPRPPKYEIYTDAGKHITWTGQGRKPNVFIEQLDMGKSMDDFLIK